MFALRLQPSDITQSLHRCISTRYRRKLERIGITLDAFGRMEVRINSVGGSVDNIGSVLAALTGCIRHFSKPLNEIYVRGLRKQWDEYRAVVDSPLWR